jgi:hypothetical protein
VIALQTADQSSRQGAPEKQDQNFETATFQQEAISGHKSQSGFEWVGLDHPVNGGYGCGNLVLQVGGTSDETVIYGYVSCATLTSM